MNISYDDTSPYLQFSQEWRVQPDNDASSASFWQNTYHAVQSRGATLRITFNGAGIYIYGSKGPHNAGYTVELDDKVFIYNDKPSSVQYQQLLFGQSVRQGGHTIVLTHDGSGTTAGSDNSWLDVDYIMITQPLPNGVDTQSDPGSIETTGGPPGASNSGPTSTDPNSTGSRVPLPGETGGANGSTNNNNSLTTVVILLAALLGLVLVGAMAYFIWRRIVKNRKAEQAFRHGTNQAPTATMLSHTTGVTLPPAGPFDTPPGSAMVHQAPFNVTDSPVTSVLQIGRSVAMLESDGSAEVVPRVRTHSSLSEHTGFSQTSYAITPEGAFAAHPLSRHNSYDALRDVVAAQPSTTMDSSYAVPPPPPPPPPPASTPSSWNSDRPSRGPPGQRQPRTWNPAAGAPSIKTFVQVMDE